MGIIKSKKIGKYLSPEQRRSLSEKLIIKKSNLQKKLIDQTNIYLELQLNLSNNNKNIKKSLRLSRVILKLNNIIIEIEYEIIRLAQENYSNLDLKNFKRILSQSKGLKYLTQDECVYLSEKLNLKKKGLEIKLDSITEKYIEISTKNTARKNYKQIFRLSRKMGQLKTTIQRYEIEIYRLDQENHPRLNIFQKFKKYFALMSYQQQKRFFGIMFLLPWFIGFCIFFAIPMGTTIWWSLNNMSMNDGGGYTLNFAWFSNYIDAFTNITLAGKTISERLTISITDIIINLPTIIIFSLFIAVLLNTRFKGHQIVKAIFFIPVIYNLTIINNTLTVGFGHVVDSGMGDGFVLSSQFSNFLMQVGIGNGLVEFLTNAVDRIFTIVNMSGIQIIIFIAALQSIPVHLYEAARVEGATKYEMFWKITIPMVSPMILTAVVYTIVDSFAISDIMHYMTVNSQGTNMGVNQPGIYSAISIVYFLANALIIVIVFAMMRKVVFYHDK